MCWEHSSEFEGRGADDVSRDYHAKKRNKSTVMDFDIYESFVRSLRSTGTRKISFAGIGEPLLHKRIVDAVTLAKSLGMKVWITTNGSLLTQKLMSELIDAGLDDVNISLNAGAVEEYNLVHTNQNGVMFDEIVNNLEWLKEYKYRRRIDTPRVTISNVISNLNRHRLVDMMHTAIRVNATNVSYRPIDVCPQTERFALGPADLETMAGEFATAAELGKSKGVDNNIISFYQILRLRAADNLPSPCFAGWLYPFVLANGDVTHCCTSREVLGNLEERSFKSIWFDPNRRYLNNQSLNIHKTQIPVSKSRCFGCELTLSNQRIYNRLWPLWGRAQSVSEKR